MIPWVPYTLLHGGSRMRTNIELDDALVDLVRKLGQFDTKKAAVNAALAEYARLLKRRQVLALRGRVRWRGNLRRLRASRTG